ncbi:hypothetical protein [Burkholderia sp. Ac-20365]|uniref:hypothetical protein n=1 Tax=Burkholderia sp. Ac-20365 TaxID=2703897 RepID=UPI00197B4250|nr:hypothetical protein [Burkholderia sp. Ac-20365]MBN3759548.1 hypothetical protein [Burkholderia sp. Ac-20365]
MSAPESNSKVPPSLLSEPVKDGQAGGSRILANLEGRVDPSANQKPKRSRTLPVVVAALVIVAGGVGAWQLQQRSSVAGADKVAANGASTVVTSSIKVASGVTASMTASASAASAPTAAPATIVADDDASKDKQPTQASSDDGNRLSRALADGAGASDGPASAAIVSSAKADDAAKPASASNTKHADTETSKAAHSKHDKRQLAEERRVKESKAAVASTTKKKQAGKQEVKDDSDADLLAALVARTKPASANGAKATDSQVASKKVSATGNSTGTLADRINECGQHGFFEEQLCRWRVCDGHWGKDPHCPAASAQARQP